MINRIFFASGNSGKIQEVKALMHSLNIELLTSADISGYKSVEETGSSFLENAYIKAEAGRTYVDIPVLAEDAGLEVFELNNEPGIYSARYLGHIPQEEKNENIIQRLNAIPHARRDARFCSTMVLYLDNERTIVSEGFCYGKIAVQARGKNGFGYDPIFELPELMCSMAQLNKEEKNKISHRSSALRGLYRRLELWKEKTE